MVLIFWSSKLKCTIKFNLLLEIIFERIKVFIIKLEKWPVSHSHAFPLTRYFEIEIELGLLSSEDFHNTQVLIKCSLWWWAAWERKRKMREWERERKEREAEKIQVCLSFKQSSRVKRWMQKPFRVGNATLNVF